MEKGFQILDNNIKQNYNILHNEVLQTNNRIDKGFNYIQNQISDINNNINIRFNDVKEDIKDVRKEIQQNSYLFNNQISNLNNLYNHNLVK
jgi:hypothetical protein